MFKIIIMALLIFIGMVGYDNITDKAQPTTPVQQEQQKSASTKNPQLWLCSSACCLPRRNGPRPYINSIWPLIWMRLSILSVKTQTGQVLMHVARYTAGTYRYRGPRFL